MNRRTILTLSTAAVLYGLHALYAVLVTPRLAPPVTEVAQQLRIDNIDQKLRPARNREEAERWLSHVSWVPEAGYQFRAGSSYIYAKEWHQVEATGEIRFEPFAMIWHRGEDPVGAQVEPITIISDSALLKFEQAVDLSAPQAGGGSPKPGRIIGGALEGEVQVRGPDQLSVTGRNFNFKEQSLRVWSDNPVAFTYRRNSGTGHGLEMDLIAHVGTPYKDKPNIDGVRTVRLQRDVEMHLLPNDRAEKVSRDRKEAPRTVVVTSQGQFEYMLEPEVATFHNDVRVQSPTGPREYDLLRQCDQLTLIFERESKSSPGKHPVVPVAPISAAAGDSALPALPPTPTVPSPSKPAGELQFRRMKAEGKQVLLTSQRSQLTALAAEVTYEAQTRVVALRDERQVRVTQKNNEIVAPEITLQLSQGGPLQWAVCRGRGNVRSYAPELPGAAAPRELLFSAEWQREMRKFIDPQTKLDVIELLDQAILNRPGQMALRAQSVKVWLRPEAKSPSRSRSAASPPGSGMQLKQLLALDDVAFATPQLRGLTPRLEVWFEPGKLQPHPGAAHSDSPAGEPNRTAPEVPGAAALAPPYNAPAEKQTGALPAGAREREGERLGLAAVNDTPPPYRERHRGRGPAAGGRKSAQPAAGEAAHPLHITAELIRVRAVQEGQKTDVAEVWNEGRVHVSQERDPPQPRLDVRGDRLHLKNYLGDNQVLEIVGTPADVRDRGLRLEGADIKLDRFENTLHVVGAGMLRLPLQSGLDGKKLPEQQFLDVWWKERMDFDGLKATFLANVTAVLGENRMTCQEMDVTLTRKVSFSEAAPEGQQPEVEVVHCKEGVQMENQEYVETRLTEIRKAKAWEMTLTQSTGDVTAAGPGVLQLWRRKQGKSNTPRGMGLRGAALPRPAAVESPSGWEYTKVEFTGAMRGNRNQRSTTFRDRVRILHGPVEQSSEVLDSDDLPVDGATLTSEALQLTQNEARENQPPFMQMLATGNAKVEGRGFHGLADSISYDESKGAFLLRSVGTRKATIWRQLKPGSEPNRFEAQRMEFIPSRNYLKSNETFGGGGLLSP